MDATRCFHSSLSIHCIYMQVHRRDLRVTKGRARDSEKIDGAVTYCFCVIAKYFSLNNLKTIDNINAISLSMSVLTGGGSWI